MFDSFGNFARLSIPAAFKLRLVKSKALNRLYLANGLCPFFIMQLSKTQEIELFKSTEDWSRFSPRNRTSAAEVQSLQMRPLMAQTSICLLGDTHLCVEIDRLEMLQPHRHEFLYIGVSNLAIAAKGHMDDLEIRFSGDSIVELTWRIDSITFARDL